MPTIEIVSVGSKAIGISPAHFKMAIIEQSKPISHRSLFFDFLKKEKGTILHFGNPNHKSGKSGFFGDALIDWDFEVSKYEIFRDYDPDDIRNQNCANQEFIFQFLPEFLSEFRTLLDLAIEKSPFKKAYFLTDYQFGPSEGQIEKAVSVEQFWQLHELNGLTFNSLYVVLADN